MKLHTIATLVELAAAFPATVFPFLYHILAPWRSDIIGRQIMSISIVIALFLDLAAFVRLAGPYPGLEQVAIVLYVVLTVLLWRQLIFLLSVQIGRRRKKGNPDKGHDVTDNS